MKCDIRKFTFPMNIVHANYMEIVDTETMQFAKSDLGDFDYNNWIILDPDEHFAVAYNIVAIEAFDSDSDELNYIGFKLSRNCGHNSVYPHLYYREIDE